MDQDPDPIAQQKKCSAVPLRKLREFHEKCLAVGDAGSQLFLLLGDYRQRDTQLFRVIRIFDSPGFGRQEEPIGTFRTEWRGKALRTFKDFLDRQEGGYAHLSFLRTSDMI